MPKSESSSKTRLNAGSSKLTLISSPADVLSVHPLISAGLNLKCTVRVFTFFVSAFDITKFALASVFFNSNLKSLSDRKIFSSTKKPKGVCLVRNLCGGVFDILSMTIRKPECATSRRDSGWSYSNLSLPGFFSQMFPVDILPSELTCSKLDFNETIEFR